MLLLPPAEQENKHQIQGGFQRGPQLLTSHWKFLKIWPGISSSALTLSPSRELGASREKLGRNGSSGSSARWELPGGKGEIAGYSQDKKYTLWDVLPSRNDERFEEIKVERLWSGREGAQVALGQGFVPTNPTGAQSKPSPCQGPLIHGEAAGGPEAAPSCRVIPAPSHSLNPWDQSVLGQSSRTERSSVATLGCQERKEDREERRGVFIATLRLHHLLARAGPAPPALCPWLLLPEVKNLCPLCRVSA